MVATANIIKFFEDHPELEDRKGPIHRRVNDILGEGTIMASMIAEIIMGDLWPRFIIELVSDEKHDKIHWQETLKAGRGPVKTIDQLCQETGRPREFWEFLLSGNVKKALEMEGDAQP